ncbi:unnamed protein product [Toxocara canis]|uniref:DH domain-containing protein n=1 Tax=Toxocara canis TaxID=6265 RepID=A0A183V102_TOXCA|nr:unnamed protein product [Toxocara canis]
MRPLRQPLECTLIDAGLADKIFYKIPEILIHHQHFLAALRDRLDNFQSDTRIGDVLLSHFKKQSMIETYIAFVDNFKFAKQSIIEARAKPAFEKYYMRCCRDHRNKLDLDSLLISPVQRVPRYELILKQIVKHTSVEHSDYENLLLAQKHIHELATTINRQKEESEEMEQRLREIEAIVDGLDDLVTTGRSFNRYDVVTISNSGGSKQRCLFLMSDQIILTSVRRKSPSTRSGRNSASLVQSADFLDSNRFKLLFKISLDDIEISKDSLSLLQSTELRLQAAQEDVNILNKMIELSKLLKSEHSALTTMLDNMRTERMQELRALQEQLTSDPELTTVHLQVTTINGIESLTIHFSNADKRAIWENALVEAKNALINSLQNDQAPNHLRSIVTHRTRSGLIFSVASPTLGKSMEGGAPNVWVCTTDKFSGQIAVVNVNGEPTIESSTGIGNAAIIAICPVPSPRKRRKVSVKASVDGPGNEIPGLELDSSSSDSDDSDSDSSRRNIQSTIWIGNEDGEIFVFNFLDNVRLKSREKMTRLPLPIDDIVYVDEKVFVSLSSSSHVQLVYFQRGKEGNWDMENSKNVRLDLHTRLRPMIAVVSRLCIASANSLYLINPSTTKIEKSAQVSSYPSETVACMAAHGSTMFVAMNKSSIVKVVNAFTLDCLLEFSISHVINKTLSTQEDIIRQHKMGCLRISALLCCKNRLWIGTSAGIILNANIASTKTNWTPTFNVCKAGHIGPCRFLTAVSVSSSAILFDMRRRRMSLNAPSLQQLDQNILFPSQVCKLDVLSFIVLYSFQMFVISGGEGYDNNNTDIREEKTGIDDAVNHLLFWTT